MVDGGESSPASQNLPGSVGSPGKGGERKEEKGHGAACSGPHKEGITKSY